LDPPVGRRLGAASGAPARGVPAAAESRILLDPIALSPGQPGGFEPGNFQEAHPGGFQPAAQDAVECARGLPSGSPPRAGHPRAGADRRQTTARNAGHRRVCHAGEPVCPKRGSDPTTCAIVFLLSRSSIAFCGIASGSSYGLISSPPANFRRSQLPDRVARLRLSSLRLHVPPGTCPVAVVLDISACSKWCRSADSASSA